MRCLGTPTRPVEIGRANAGVIADDIKAMAEHVAYIAMPKIGDVFVTADGRIGMVREEHPNQTYSKRFGDRAGDWA